MGGIERFLLRILPALDEHFDVIVMARAKSKGALHSEFMQAKAEIHYVPLGYFDLAGAFQLYRQLKRISPDSFCDLTGIFGGFPLLVARLAAIPRRIAFHRRTTYAFHETIARRAYAKASLKLIEWFATAIASNSETALGRFHASLHRRDSRLHVIRNILDVSELETYVSREQVRRELGLPMNAWLALHVGRRNRAKGQDTILAAAAQVLKRDLDVYFVLAGRDTEEWANHELFEKSTLRKRVRLLGNRTDIPDLLNAADFFFFLRIPRECPMLLSRQWP